MDWGTTLLVMLAVLMVILMSGIPVAFAFLELQDHATYLDSDSRAMGRRPMTPSSGLVVPDRVHAHTLLSVLPPEKLFWAR